MMMMMMMTMKKKKKKAMMMMKMMMTIMIFKNYFKYLTLFYIPVSILSLTIQFPVIRTASHCMMHPPRGISIISPGTRSSDDSS